MKTINQEDREFIEFAYSLLNKARYASFEKITEVYNRVFGTTLKSTNCGTCMRQRVLELKKELDKLIKHEQEEKEEKETLSTNIQSIKENNEVNKESEVHQEVKEEKTEAVEGHAPVKSEETEQSNGVKRGRRKKI